MLKKKRLKFRRIQKKRVKINWITPQKNILNFGKYGLKADECGIVTKRQIEAARRSITRRLKKSSKVWINARVNRPVTAKPQGIRMGKGKGSVAQKTRFVRKGEILFEIGFLSKTAALKVLEKTKRKLPIAARAITKGR